MRRKHVHPSTPRRRLDTPAPETCVNEVVWRGPAVTIGAFRCGRAHRLWNEENHIRDGHNIVFTRTAVRIAADGFKSGVYTPNTASFYNFGQTYRRWPISPEGEVSEYFVLRPDVLAEIIREYNPDVMNRPDRPFRVGAVPCDSDCYLLQRLLFTHVVTAASPPDPLCIEETFLHVARRLVRRAFDAGAPARRPPDHRTRTAEAADAVRIFVTRHFREPVTLDAVADAVGLSLFHLCRVFKREEGIPIHRFLRRVRLRSALQSALDGDAPLTAVALDHGFSSHSHFTDAFRQEFRFSPSQLRSSEKKAALSKMSKILEAAPRPRR